MSQRAQRLIEAARKLPVPEGTYAVGLGLLISGITAYGFQILAFKGARPSPSTRRSTGCGSSCSSSRPGSSCPSSRRSAGRSPTAGPRSVGGGPVVAQGRDGRRRSSPASLMAFSIDRLRSRFGLTERLFHGQEVLLVCFVIALGTYAVQHITRGTLSGNGRFGPYGHDPRRRGPASASCP